MTQARHEEELLAIYDPDGRRIGVKSRTEVHRDENWHILVFVFAARIDSRGNKRAIFQLRARPDDPYRGHIDAIAGGHVTADETCSEAATREFLEEVGLHIGSEELVELGQRTLHNPDGICKRVIQHFYLFAFNGTLTNHSILRDQLADQKNFHFVLDSDTEVIEHYLAHNLSGDTMPDLETVMQNLSERFDGSYCIVILDSAGRMMVARDPLGLRPLNWAQ